MMRIGIFQFSPVFGDRPGNMEKIRRGLASSTADCVVLPELCLTGYQFLSAEEAAAAARPADGGEDTAFFLELASDLDCFIAAGVAEKGGDGVYNSAILAGPGGTLYLYRKVHLFNREKDCFLPGNLGFPVFDIGTAAAGMMVCFDWAFPEAARSLAVGGAGIILHPANLVLPLCQRAMVTRSIENGVFTVTANRVGTEERPGREQLVFTGGSQVVGPRGDVLLRIKSGTEDYREVDIDVSAAEDKFITPRNHLLRDRRTNMYRSRGQGN